MKVHYINILLFSLPLNILVIQSAEKAGAAEGASQGAAAGVDEVIKLIKLKFHIEELSIGSLDSIINTNTYTDVTLISRSIHSEYSRLGCASSLLSSGTKKPICTSVHEGIFAQRAGTGVSANDFIKTAVQNIASDANGVAEAKAAKVAAAKTPTLEAKNIAAVEATTTPYYTPIIASIIAIEVIVLIM
ncbi:hypothetical protein PFNF135_00009 [Plasmodium falciparum NF135/5.C10]|uniref:Surface antigen n=1 Tax=Plasmodium falciparum NF135/5.C10 TaxID=1036726 RepID=W4IPY7_PLAFA|nr:hypothetical protein PFNF135_00009 [Plasmodium falciparum NF135/5.C10]